MTQASDTNASMVPAWDRLRSAPPPAVEDDRFAISTRARLLVLGGTRDVLDALAGAQFTLRTIGAGEDLCDLGRTTADAIVFDREHMRVDVVRKLRETMLRNVPLLVIDGARPSDTAAIDAEARISRPIEPSDLRDRLLVLAELGRSRRALGVAERARERARAALDERRVLTSAILDSLQAAVFVTDAHGRISFANRAARSTLRVPGNQCLGMNVIDVLRLPEDARRCFSDVCGVADRSISFTLPHRGGAAANASVTISRVEGPSPRGFGFFVVFPDVVQPPQTELQQHRVERLAAMGTMAAGFAHEVRNPVASLRLLGEALAAELERDNPLHEYVARMMRQLERIERLVRTSLQFSRPEPPRRGIRSAASIAAIAVDEVRPRTQELKGTIRIEAEPDLPAVYVDDTQIVQVLVILLNNALDATGCPDKVRLRVRSGHSDLASDESAPSLPEEVAFDVIDEGPGIPAHLLWHVFDPFFTTKPAGTGLGLSIAQQIVHENKGRIELSSTPGRATTFTVLVPRRGS